RGKAGGRGAGRDRGDGAAARRRAPGGLGAPRPQAGKHLSPEARRRDDFVKVLDFGVSKLIDSATLTQEKAMVGTPLYMSPEQAVGTQELTPESDIFSLGAISYEMLTGRRAFAASSIPSILYQIVHGPTP